jgi:hypothetical protein
MATQPNPRSRGDFSERVGVVLVQELVPFIIPDLHCDLRFSTYLTAELARTSADERVRAIHHALVSYFEEIDLLSERALADDKSAATELGKRLAFGERSEAGIGYVRKGHKGSASGPRVTGAFLRNVLLTYPALRKVLTRHADALHGIPRFDMDRVGDAILNIALREFVELTQAYAVEYGFAVDCLAECSWRYVWNRKTRSFDETYTAKLPVDYRGRPLLLLPKEIVRGSPPFSAADFIDDNPVSADGVRDRLTKAQLLEKLGLSIDKLEHFVIARFVGIAPHRRFQGDIKRRRKPRG